MKYCSKCGGQVSLQVPAGDDRERYVCSACITIHYQNPRLVTGCIPQWGEQVLMCKRAIEPRCGFWTLPAGYMENGETSEQGAARETLEEANARVEIVSLFAFFNIPHINQIYMLYRATLLDLDFFAGQESLEVRLFTEDEIPWDDVAFPAIHKTLTYFFEDRLEGKFGVHCADIDRRPVKTS